jgi:hypothetical protein
VAVIRLDLSPETSDVRQFLKMETAQIYSPETYEMLRHVTGRQYISGRCRLLPVVRAWCRANLKYCYVPRAVGCFVEQVDPNSGAVYNIKSHHPVMDFDDEVDAVLFKARWL